MVSRGRNTRSFGLPGGRVEPRDASVAAAAARELEEETGLAVRPDELRRVFEKTCKGHLSTCFLVRASRRRRRQRLARRTARRAAPGG